MRELEHPSITSKGAYIIRLFGPVLMLLALLAAGAAVYLSATASESYGMRSIMIDDAAPTEYEASSSATLQIFTVRVDGDNMSDAKYAATNPRVTLPAAASMPAGAVVTVRNGCVQRKRLTGPGPAYVSEGAAKSVKVRRTDAEGGTPVEDAVPPRTSRSYVVADVLGRGARWYNAGLPAGSV